MKTRSRKVTALLVALALALPVGGVTLAAYVATTDSSGNRIEAGSVKIDDDDANAAMLSLANAQPGATDTSCLKVTFNGSIDSTVRLYGTTGGIGLDPYLDLRVTRGANSPSDPGFDSCANFSPDGTDYIGAGNGVIYEGSLQGYPDDYAAGQVDPTAASPETWTNGESHVYKIEVTQRFNVLASGLSATQSFTWEARNQ